MVSAVSMVAVVVVPSGYDYSYVHSWYAIIC